jgi:hypothetical protein
MAWMILPHVRAAAVFLIAHIVMEPAVPAICFEA